MPWRAFADDGSQKFKKGLKMFTNSRLKARHDRVYKFVRSVIDARIRQLESGLITNSEFLKLMEDLHVRQLKIDVLFIRAALRG